MYISVDSYREMYLNGKDAKEITEEIKKIRREIEKTKYKLESPANVYDSRHYPAQSAAIDVYRDYLNAAFEYLSNLTGEVCDLTEEEKAALIFDSTVDEISGISITVGNYLQNKYELTFSGEEAKVCETHLGEDSICTKIDYATAKETIRALHIGEWRETYTPDQYGCTLNEPTKWQLRIDYKNGSAPRFYDGAGVFPYNFKSLLGLLGADII